MKVDDTVKTLKKIYFGVSFQLPYYLLRLLYLQSSSNFIDNDSDGIIPFISSFPRKCKELENQAMKGLEGLFQRLESLTSFPAPLSILIASIFK